MDSALSPRPRARERPPRGRRRRLAIVDEGRASTRRGRPRCEERADRDHLPGRHRPGRPRPSPERLPDRAVRPRRLLPARRVPGPQGPKIALLYDDTGYGQQGRQALAKAFALNPESVATRIDVPAEQTDLSPQVLRAKRSGATRCSSGRAARRSRTSSSPRAAAAGRCRSTRRPPAPTRSSGSSSPTTRSGSTG